MRARVSQWTLCCLATLGLSCAGKTPPPALPPPVTPAPAAAAAPSPAATPQDAPATADAPRAPRSADAIVADAIQAMGTPEAWKAHKTLHLTLEMSFQGLGITGTAERFLTADDKSLAVTTIPGVGTMREGSNGRVLWSSDPINGVRVLEGAEAEQARVDSVWNPELRFGELYQQIEAKNDAGPDGRPLECLVLTPKSAPATTNCYDPTTHLQVLQKGIRATPQGDTPFLSTVGDWREVGGLKMPFSVVTQAGPITFKGTLKSAAFDQPMDEKMFEPPAPPTPAKPPTKQKSAPMTGGKKKP